MSRRQAHTQAGFAGTAATLIGIAVAGYQDPSLPVFAGAARLHHFVGAAGLALACGWVGARLPDWIEPPHTPHHRGFWHSWTLGTALLLVLYLLVGGFTLEQPRPAVFLSRIAALFLAVGYLTHLGLDLRSDYGLPRFRNHSRTTEGLGLPFSPAKLLALVGLGILTVGVVRTFVVFAGRLAAFETIWQPLLLGIGAGAILAQFALRGQAKGLHALVHKAAHATAALLFWRKVDRFICTCSKGGAAQHQDRFGGKVADTIITLAPYFWPTFTAVAVLVRPLVAIEWLPRYDLIIGATIGFHLATSLRDLKRGGCGDSTHREPTQPVQTDIAKSGGLLISTVCVAVAALTTYSLLAALIVSGYEGFVQWVQVTGRGVWLTVIILGRWITDAFHVLVTE